MDETDDVFNNLLKSLDTMSGPFNETATKGDILKVYILISEVQQMVLHALSASLATRLDRDPTKELDKYSLSFEKVQTILLHEIRKYLSDADSRG